MLRQAIGTTSQNASSTSFEKYAHAEATITPKSANSKILVMMEAAVEGFDNADNADTELALYKDGVLLSRKKRIRVYDNGGNGVLVNADATINHLDEPATTNSITYQIYFRKVQGHYNNTISNASITLMEIGV